MHAKDPYSAKYQFLINNQESTGLKHLIILKLLLNTQKIWMIFIKTLNNTNQTENVKY